MITFGSRGSDLALTQTRMVGEALSRQTGLDHQIEIIETRGDRDLVSPLPTIGGKGVFTAELEEALRAGRIDAAVHSLKDLPVDDPQGLTIGAIPARIAANDVLVANPARIENGALRPGARVGTSSLRRRSAFLVERSDLVLTNIRGNVPTRVDRVRRGDYDATVLAAAGLDRLDLDLGGLTRMTLPIDRHLPAPGQGALAVQCRADDEKLLGALRKLHHPGTSRCVGAERELLHRLGGGCSMPLGALCTPHGDDYRLRTSLFGRVHAGCGVFTERTGTDPTLLAADLAADLSPLVGDPLEGLRVALLRPDGNGGRLGQALGVAGATVETIAMTRTIPVEAALHTEQAAAIAFTSARAVARFQEQVSGPVDAPIFAIGPATAAALRSLGFECRVPQPPSGGATLARFLIDSGITSGRVLFPCAADRQGDLERVLGENGVAVDAVPLYQTERIEQPAITRADDWLVFSSPSATGAWVASGSQHDGQRLALGETTAAAMVENGIRCDAIAATPSAGALITAMKEARQ